MSLYTRRSERRAGQGLPQPGSVVGAWEPQGDMEAGQADGVGQGTQAMRGAA